MQLLILTQIKLFSKETKLNSTAEVSEAMLAVLLKFVHSKCKSGKEFTYQSDIDLYGM